MIDEKRLAVMRPEAVGSALHLHLDNTEIDAELEFLTSIEAGNLAHFDRADLMRPIVE